MLVTVASFCNAPLYSTCCCNLSSCAVELPYKCLSTVLAVSRPFMKEPGLGSYPTLPNLRFWAFGVGQDLPHPA
jgi:hypothetical protein